MPSVAFTRPRSPWAPVPPSDRPAAAGSGTSSPAGAAKRQVPCAGQGCGVGLRGRAAGPVQVSSLSAGNFVWRPGLQRPECSTASCDLVGKSGLPHGLTTALVATPPWRRGPVHAGATVTDVEIALDDGMLQVRVRDGGVTGPAQSPKAVPGRRRGSCPRSRRAATADGGSRRAVDSMSGSAVRLAYPGVVPAVGLTSRQFHSCVTGQA